MVDDMDSFLESVYDELKRSIKGYIHHEYIESEDTYRVFISRKDVTYRFKLEHFKERLNNNLTVWTLVNMIESNYKRVLVDNVFFNKKGERDNVAINS